MKTIYISILVTFNLICAFTASSQTRYGGSVPNNAISNVSPNANIELFFFDGEIQNSSLNANNIIIRGSYTGIIPGVFSNYDVANFRVTFNAAINFKPGETISIEVTNRVRSATNQPILDPGYSSFTVATSPQDPAGTTFYAKIIDSNADGLTRPVTGDINKNGRVDIMAVAFTNGSISWYRNEGGNIPAFTKQTIFSGSPNGINISDLVDINRDGFLDFFANIFGNVFMFLHDGNTANPGFIQTPIGGSSALSNGRVTAIDLNKDGHLDVVVTSSTKCYWLENSGTGTYTERLIINENVFAIAAADIDNEGDVDIVLSTLNSGTFQSELYVYYNNGAASPTFTPTQIATGISLLEFIDIKDINLDGRMDIIIRSNTAPEIRYYRNNLNNTFSQQTIFNSNSFFAIQPPTLADIDGDGDLDAISGNFSNGRIALFTNNGSGSFTSNFNIGSVTNPNDVTTADLNNDGDLEIISTSFSGDNLSWLSTDLIPPTLISNNPLNAANNVPLSQSIVTGFDSNIITNQINTGNMVLTGSQSGLFSGTFSGLNSTNITFNPSRVFKPGEQITATVTGGLVTNPGSFSFLAEVPQEGAPAGETSSKRIVSNNAGQATSVVLADLDNDGDLDMVVASLADNKITWHENDGQVSPTFIEHIITTSADGVWNVNVADVNADGFMDILAVSVDNNYSQWYENDGGSTPAFSPRLLNTAAVNPRCIVGGDIDNDGDIDILVASFDNDYIRWFRNDGDAVPNFGVSNINNTLDGIRNFTLGDMDNDGDLDIIVASFNDNTISWLENDGAADPSFTKRIISNSATGAQWVRVGDLDNDGFLDVVSASAGNNRITWYKNDGATVPAFAATILTTNANQARAIEIGDMDGDGDLDIAAISSGDNTLRWFENNGNAASFTIKTINTTLIGGYSVTLGDIDGNGTLDIVSASQGDNTVAWFATSICPNGNVLYVNQDATGANNGTSWLNAYTDLQSALENSCPDITEIWVAAGTYYPSQNISFTSTGLLDRNNTFSLRNGVAIYGGFNGTEANLSERDWNLNITILSGDLDQNDGPEAFNNNNGNALTVVTAISLDSTATIDGFTIEGGNANNNSLSLAPENTDRTGGGMYNYQAAPTIMNCNFKNNYALFGGGMFNLISDPFISNCIFSGNSAVIGGGIDNATSSPTIINCVIEGNYASDEGGGMSISSASTPKIINCTISGNEAADNGGAAVIINSTTPEFINCIIWNNLAQGSTTSSTATFKTNFTVSVSYSNCIIANSGGSANWLFNANNIDGGNNLDLDPIFLDQPIPGLGSTGNFRLQACSPAINTGSNDALPGEITTDVDNNERIFDNIVDMGAYEYRDAPAPVATLDCSSIFAIRNTDTDQCNYTVQGMEFDPEIEGDCPIAGIENDFNNESTLGGAVFESGDTEVVWTITDSRGDTSSCTITVTIADDENPVALCAPSLNIYLDENGEASITALEINEGSTDNCSIITLSINQENFDCSHLGDNIVTLTITDAINNSSQCTSIVTVEDNLPPIAICSVPFNIQLDENGQAGVSPAEINNGSSDNCEIGSLSINQEIFDCLHLGDNTITLIVTDLNNNSSQCTTVITIEDNLAPTAQCITSLTIQLEANGVAGVTPTDVNSGSTDNCEIDTYSITQENFDCSNLGDNTITLTITDINNNSSQCTTIVTVEDNIEPVAQCVAPFIIQLDADGEASITLADINIGSIDNCGISTFSINQENFDCSHIGLNEITLTVTDNFNNSSQCTSIITVEDNSAPIAQCANPFTIQLDENGEAVISPVEVNNGSTDNCEIGTLSINQENFDCSHVGDNTITLIVTDAQNNSSQCTTTLTVEDTIPPNLLCYNQTIEFNGESNIQLNENELVFPEDSCGVQSISLSSTSVSSTQLGQTIPVISTVMDVNGNTSTCTSLITITGLPSGWSQNPNGIGCSNGNDFGYNAETEIWTAVSTNCYYSNPFTSDAAAFAQRTLCGNGSITALVTGISGNAPGWAGVIMRESNDPGSKKAQLTTNMAGNQSRREFRVMTNGMAIPQNFPAQGRYWLRVVRSGNQFIIYNSQDGNQWFIIGAQMIDMNACIQIGLVATNYNDNSTVTATFANVSFDGSSSIPQNLSGENSNFSFQSNDFDAYPNPTSGELNLNLNEYIGKKVQIELYSLEGKLMNFIQLDEVLQSNQTIKLESFSNGLYLLKLKSEGLLDVIKKIVLQH